MLPYRRSITHPSTPDIILEDSPASSSQMLNPHSHSQPHASTSRQHSYQSTAPSSYKYTPDEEEEPDVFDPFSIDPDYRLRTVRTAASAIAESIRTERDAEDRKRKRRIFKSFRSRRGTKSSFKRKGSEQTDEGAISEHGTPRGSIAPPLSDAGTDVAPSVVPDEEEKVADNSKTPAGQRRTLFVNMPLPTNLLDQKGDPIMRYVRNKVRTSKYTILTFLPKNLFEQFRRAANVFFLAMVILQLFSVFGAPNPQIGMLPLLAILGMTAIKDAIEDWRRGNLDNEVNNSAATKLGGWRNVNQPVDPRNWFERILGLNAPDKPSKGVRKLRNAEAKAGHEIVMERQKEMEEEEEEISSAAIRGQYPPEQARRGSLSSDHSSDGIQTQILRKIPSAPSMMSRKSSGVVDWSQQSRGTAHWERTLWKKLEAGDFVLLRDNEQIPADIVVLATSHADSLAFVETKNLDGETNLKIRKALKATSSMQSEEDLERAHFVIDSEPPHANLYAYNGVLKYWPTGGESKHATMAPGEEKQEAITINELLLRGCMIRNTKWVIGMVVFTGSDTKIMLNGGDTPSKRSKIEKETNFNVIMNFVVLILLCLITAILHGWYRSLSGTSADTYEAGSWAADNIYLDSLIIFASCLIVFQNIVPISLYITIEIVKTAFFIFQDVEMYYEPYDTPCVPKTWNISDDLGQIEYVFSDKTGTLTQNVMEFKKCSIQGVSFGEGITEAMMGAAIRDGRYLGASAEDQDEEIAVMKDKMVTSMTRAFDNRYFREEQLTLIAPDLPAHFANVDDPLRPHLIEFFRALAICHSVLSDVADPKKPFVVDYKAESPDEAALVAAARDVGFPFVNRNNNRIDIEILGKPEKWTPLRVLEFNSTRKRMSVLARDPSGRVVLFCKGADSVIYERLTPDHDPELKASTLKDLETFANGGLRTLCIAQRYLTDEEYEPWSKRYDAACAAVVDREAEIEKACESVEHSLTILGATALEDKLQEGVPDAIAMLHQAGIKLWILTGDKLQTAIEIGYSCNLLTNDMEVMIISADSEQGARAQIEAGLNKIASVLGPPVVNKRKSQIAMSRPAATFAVVIDGDSLRFALQPSLKSLFLSLGTQCAAVICCRVSPSQKALTVKLVKDGCNAMTLSIGDGANDVAMIQEANVGVGLFGLEGSQAAMSADYAFGQFRFLTRLLLVHGRWSYVRIADMHANFFYKNIIWTISMFWFLIFNSFDATYLFEYTFLLLYNLVFTSLPVAAMGAFDQDTNAKASMAFPQLYKRGIQGLEYTRRRFWIYMADGLYQSCIIFFIPYLTYAGGTPWSSDGLDTDSLWDFGTTVAAAGVFAANLYVGINTRYWMFMSWIVIVGSILLVYLWIPIYSYLSSPPYYGTVDVVYPTFSFWATVIITVAFAVGPRWLANAFRQSYLPRDKDIIREAWIAGELKDSLGVEHRKRKKNRKKVQHASNIGQSAVDLDVDVDHSHSHTTPPLNGLDAHYANGLGHDLESSNPDSRYMDHVRKGLSGDDGRGIYAPAAMASPHKSTAGLLSGQSTPRSQYGYAPSSPLADPLSPTLQAAFNRTPNRTPSPMIPQGRSDGGSIPPVRPPRPEVTRGLSGSDRGLTMPRSELGYGSPNLYADPGSNPYASTHTPPVVRRTSSDRRQPEQAWSQDPRRRSSLGDPLSGGAYDGADFDGHGQGHGYAQRPVGGGRTGGYEGQLGGGTRRDVPTIDLTDTDADERDGRDQQQDEWARRQAGERKSYVDFSSPRGSDW